jgi:hypothetical protein
VVGAHSPPPPPAPPPDRPRVPTAPWTSASGRAGDKFKEPPNSNYISKRNDAAGLVLGHLSSGRNLRFAGRFASSRSHLEEVLALYDPNSHRSLVDQIGTHPQNSSQSLLGIVLCCLGFPDQALAKSNAATAEARRLAHPPSLASSLANGIIVLLLVGDNAALDERAEHLIAVATEQVFPSGVRWERSVAAGSYIGSWSVTGAGCCAAAAGPDATSPGTPSTKSKNGHRYCHLNCASHTRSCRRLQCCEPTSEERWCGKSARHVLWEPGRATASGDPVPRVKAARSAARRVPRSRAEIFAQQGARRVFSEACRYGASFGCRSRSSMRPRSARLRPPNRFCVILFGRFVSFARACDTQLSCH